MLNFNRTAGQQKEHEVSFIRTSDANVGKNYYVLLVGDISTNLPDALGKIPANYQGDDLVQHRTSVYWNPDMDKLFVEWIHTGVEQDEDGTRTHVDPTTDLGLDNTKPMGKQSFGSRNPQPELFVPVLTGVQSTEDGFVLSNLAVKVFRIKGQHQIKGMLGALQNIRKRKVLNHNDERVEETSGVGRVLIVEKSGGSKTEYKFSIDETAALPIGEWAKAGVQAANNFIKAEVKRIDIWATPEVVNMFNGGDQEGAIRLAVNLVREHFMRRAKLDLPTVEDVGIEQWHATIEKLWPEVARKYYIGAAKPLQVGAPTKILGGVNTDAVDEDAPF